MQDTTVTKIILYSQNVIKLHDIAEGFVQHLEM